MECLNIFKLTRRLTLVGKTNSSAIHMGRVVPEIDRNVESDIIDNNVNPKRLVTRRGSSYVPLPVTLEMAARSKLRQFGNKQFRGEVFELMSVMNSFKQPDDEHTIRLKKADIKTELHVRRKLDFVPEKGDDIVLQEEELDARAQLNNLIVGKLQDRTRDWHYYEYDDWASHLYMAVRLPANYSVVRTVMQEIQRCDTSFIPRSVLDFGSGMGTTIWAVNEVWPNSVSEFMNVEISNEQKYLCESLLRGGKEMSEDMLPGIFHRQYLPSSTKVKYDMVVAAYSMLELPNAGLRAQTLENLWNKTNDLLIIIERGNAGGFTIVNEARHFLLDLGGHDVTKRVVFTLESRPNFKTKIPNSHVLAPCAHEFLCPRSQMTSKKNMNICRFRTHYEPLEVGMKTAPILAEDFSYVVVRKGPHPLYKQDDVSNYYDLNINTRPCRVVETAKGGTRHVIHKLCCPNGNLAECVYSRAKYGKAAYELAKSCRWGDLAPIKVKDEYLTYSDRNKKQNDTSS